MTLGKFALLAAALLAAATLTAKAEAQYAPYPGYPPYPAYTYQPPPAPPAWSYDPYTSGLVPCPQWYHGGSPTPCTPSYGQPVYRMPGYGAWAQ